MPNTWLPTQLGYLPTGTQGTPGVSTVFVGRRVSGSYEGIGFGANGRPDYAETVIINLVDRTTNGDLAQRGTITINVDDIAAIMSTRPQFPSNLNLTLKEVIVCDNGVAKGMMILGSQLYSTGSS